MHLKSILLCATFLLVVAVSYGTGQASPSLLPGKFLGKWEVDKSENFDEYLEAKGYGWFMRQMVKLASITKIFTHKGNGAYNCKILTTKKNVEWDNWRLGVEFQGEYMDDSQHKITISYDPTADKMIERHITIGSDQPADVYEYHINNEGFMVMHMSWNGVGTNRFYKKTG